MKRSLLGISVGLLAAAAFAQGPVYSVNVVGFNKLTLERGKLYMIASAFEDIDGKELRANDVLGTQVPAGTQLNHYDGSPYKTDARAGFGANNGWSSNITFNGYVGFWIKIPAGAAQPTYDVVLKGQVPMDGAVTNVVTPGLNMLGFPYTADVAFSNTALFALAQTGDQLQIWNPATTNYQPYIKPGFGTWNAGSVVLKQGQAFWFKSGRASPIAQTEVRPYPAN